MMPPYCRFSIIYFRLCQDIFLMSIMSKSPGKKRKLVTFRGFQIILKC